METLDFTPSLLDHFTPSLLIYFTPPLLVHTRQTNEATIKV